MKEKSKIFKINAENLHYRELNEKIHQTVNNGTKDIILDNINGQRYIGTGLSGDLKITINGVPGNDLAAFMDGPQIVVNDNAQDGVGNTMNGGEVIINGNAGDITGHSMRGGRIFIKGNAGYRVGIHMKAYKTLFPVVIVGGTTGDFLGEYMAGGLLIVLGLNQPETELWTDIAGNFVGTGMHGGNILIRGKVEQRCLGKELKSDKPTETDLIVLKKHIEDFCKYFNLNAKEIFNKSFVKLYPYTHRPYGRLYAY